MTIEERAKKILYKPLKSSGAEALFWEKIMSALSIKNLVDYSVDIKQAQEKVNAYLQKAVEEYEEMYGNN